MNSLILTHQEMDQKYKELGEGYKFPYFYEISNNKQTLYFLGCAHTNNPSNYQLKKVKELWRSFLDKSADNNIVLVEGGLSSPQSTKEDAIKTGGEGGLVTFLSQKVSIPVFSPEPTLLYEVSELLKRFNKEEIEYYYFARVVDQWIRLGIKSSLEDYVKYFLDRDSERLGWEDFSFTFENLVRIHDKTHNHKFDPENRSCFFNDSHPSENSVSGASSKIRNIYILKEIQKYWDVGKNIFIIYGSGHAIVLEKALKTLLK